MVRRSVMFGTQVTDRPSETRVPTGTRIRSIVPEIGCSIRLQVSWFWMLDDLTVCFVVGSGMAILQGGHKRPSIVRHRFDKIPHFYLTCVGKRGISEKRHSIRHAGNRLYSSVSFFHLYPFIPAYNDVGCGTPLSGEKKQPEYIK